MEPITLQTVHFKLANIQIGKYEILRTAKLLALITVQNQPFQTGRYSNF